MKRLLLVIGIVAQMAIGQAAQATTTTFGDNTIYWAGYPSTYAPYNSTDSINFPEYIGGVATTDLTGALTRIDIFDNPAAHAGFNQWLTAGDLFIDTGADGRWDYVVKSLGAYGNKGLQSVELFDIAALNVTTNASDASKYVYVAPNQGRDGQPIGLLSTAGAKDMGAVTYSGYYNYIPNVTKDYSVYFDFGALAIDLSNNNFILGYSPDCANDVILEKVPVPEPGTMVLFGIGLMGLVVYSKRRMSKSA